MGEVKLNIIKTRLDNKKEKWTEITDNTWIPDLGDTIEGKFIETKKYSGQYTSYIYVLKTSQDKKIRIWGSTHLNQLMDEININDYIRITYNGIKKTNNGYEMKIFKLERRIGNE